MVQVFADSTGSVSMISTGLGTVCIVLYAFLSCNKFLDCGVLTERDITADEEAQVKDFYDNWYEGRIINIPHAAMQLKITNSSFSVAQS